MKLYWPWPVLGLTLLAAVHCLGSACWDVVDAALFVVMFLTTLRMHGRLGAGTALYLPAMLVAGGTMLREYVLSGYLPSSSVLVVSLMRYAMAALMLLLVLALTARRTTSRRLYNCIFVAAFVWCLGAGMCLFFEVITPSAVGTYLLGQGLIGVLVGSYCVLVSLQRTGLRTRPADGEPAPPRAMSGRTQ